MDAARFDTLVRSLFVAPSRRAAWRWLAASALGAALDWRLESDALQAAHKHHKHRKKQCAKAGQTPKKKKRKHCCKGLGLDAAGRCQSCDVCASGCPFSELPAAIDAASAGAVVTLCAGTYNKHVVITKDLTLIGAGDGNDPTANTILTQTGPNSVVRINAAVAVTLQSLRVSGGQNISDGGGIFNVGGAATLDRCTVSGNIANGDGGGIFNTPDATMTLTNSTVTGNSADGNGGGIRNAGMLTISGSSLSGNTAGFGGGIFNTINAKLTLTDSTVRESSAEYGGGIFNAGNTTLTDSIVSENSADADGGGIYGGGFTTLIDSNVSGNMAAGSGGGIFNEVAKALVLHDSTVALNHADAAGGGIYNRGTVDCDDNNTLASNTAGNPPLPSNCVDDAGGNGCDCQP